MVRRSALIAALALTPVAAHAQAPAPAATAPAGAVPARFKWKAGEVLTYKVTQQTAVRETSLDEKTEKPVTTEARTTLALVKKWDVKGVDDKGVATLEMTITSMKTEFRKPDGTSVVRDSAVPDQAKELASFLNTPILTARVDAQGKLIEVKESKAGSAARLHAELPFRFVLPESVTVATGQTWDRAFTLKLDPPLGTGESHEFTQKYTGGVKDGLVSIGVETTLKTAPKTLAEQVPLVPMLWTGEVYFNPTLGRYHAARLKVKAELPNHQGEGTKFEYESAYVEDVVEK
ncbi:hypothetical protein [Gemmata sp.]|uniref:hypothetical protein n=1 Tax=Gemmata sp. TaxID=1914242 RepID=UPI003F6F1B26